MMPRLLRQRSSWPSSLATGLIGWNGISVIVALGLGYGSSVLELMAVASVVAVAHVVALRLLFKPLGLGRSVWRGAVWGGVAALVLLGAAYPLAAVVRDHLLAAAATALYVGAPVGVFLSYFHRDDRRIEEEAARAGRPVDYGRDAHWLDPFLYGAAGYALAYAAPSAGLVLAAAVVGSFVGVVAAGVSHFFLSRWGNAAWTAAPATAVGAGLGAASGFLFRGHAAEAMADVYLLGAAAGALTFLATSLVGRFLAKREAEAEAAAAGGTMGAGDPGDADG
jgi:hypothetical protein